MDNIKATYDRLASEYDARYLTPLHEAEDTIVGLQFVANGMGGKILSIGCGTGEDIRILGLSKDEFIGMDISAPMLEVARSKYPGYEFVEADAKASLQAVDVDGVVCLYAANYVGVERLADIVLETGATKYLFVFVTEKGIPDYHTSGMPVEGLRHIMMTLQRKLQGPVDAFGLTQLPLLESDRVEDHIMRSYQEGQDLGNSKYWVFSGECRR